MMSPYSRLEIGLSNLSLSLEDTAKFSAGSYLGAMNLGGYDRSAGLEWSVFRAFPRAVRAGRALARAGDIAVLHESFRDFSAVDLARDAVTGASHDISADAKVFVGFPRLDDRRELGQLSVTAAGIEGLPLIVHPAGQMLGNRVPRRPRTAEKGLFSELWFQPTAEWLARNGGTPEKIAEVWEAREQFVPRDAIHDEVAGMIAATAARQNLSGIALDLHHLHATRNGYRFSQPANLAHAIAKTGLVREIQVAIRPDFGGSRQTFNRAVGGQLQNTEIGEMLLATLQGLEGGESVRIVPEIPASAIQEGAGIKDYLAVHSVITNNIREIGFNAKNAD